MNPWTPGWVLTVTTPNVRLTGGGTLLATDERTSEFYIHADSVTVDHLNFTTTGVTRRWANTKRPDCASERTPASRFLGRHRHRPGSRRMAPGRHAEVHHRTAHRDRVALRRDTHDRRNLTRNPDHVRVDGAGDDGIAVVSEPGQPNCTDIVVTRPVITNPAGADGACPSSAATTSPTATSASTVPGPHRSISHPRKNGTPGRSPTSPSTPERSPTPTSMRRGSPETNICDRRRHPGLQLHRHYRQRQHQDCQPGNRRNETRSRTPDRNHRGVQPCHGRQHRHHRRETPFWSNGDSTTVNTSGCTDARTVPVTSW